MRRILTDQDFLIMRRAGKVAALALRRIGKIVKPGISTKAIEEFFDKILSGYSGMSPAFKGFQGYPASLCVSVNEEVIHGLPCANRILKDGDVVGVDLGIKYQGLFVDTAYTYIVGRGLKAAKDLVKTTKQALFAGIKQVKPGALVGDIGCAVQNFVEKHNYGVVRQYVGHGIGEALHLVPEVPNFGLANQGQELIVGTAIAIEPMVTLGDYHLEVAADGWTVKTKDKSISAHFEHTVAITKKGPWIITR